MRPAEAISARSDAKPGCERDGDLLKR